MSKTALSKGGLAADAIRAKRGAGKPKTAKPAKANGAAKAARKEATASRNAFIDARLDGKMTKRGIAQAVVDAKFGCTFEQALKAANDRPFYMRKEGKSPSWKAEEKAVEPKAGKE